MRLAELLKDWPCTVLCHDFRVDCTGVTEHSKHVKEGYIFVAKKGAEYDGFAFVKEAIESGATAIVVDRPIGQHEYKEVVPLIQVPDSSRFLSFASAKFAGYPSKELTIVAITGTNGKTTVSHFCSQLLQMHGVKTAIIGTTGIYVNGEPAIQSFPSLTTLTAEHLHPLLRRCVEEEVSYVFLEASSMGLAQDRLAHCEIDVGVFLNIGEDHYEEHGSKEAYIAAKKLLAYAAKKLVVNAEDEQCAAIVRNVEACKTFFHSAYPLADQQYEWPFIGHHNILNAQAALQVVRTLGFHVEQFYPFCSMLRLPEGRLQRIEQHGISCYIDYAHTPDALEVTLRALKPHFSNNIVAVFGCGGERDVAKRKKMGSIASQYATHLFVTSDNPRKESPEQIISTIVEGVDQQKCELIIEPDRKLAIEKAIAFAKRGDCVLVAGKGHEKTQTIGQQMIPFSDVAEVQRALKNKK